MSSVATTLRKAGYRVTASTPDELVMTHAGSSNWWLLLISWMAFWLSDTRSYQVTFKFLALADGRSRVLIIGELPSKVAAVLEDLVAPARH